MSWVNLLLNKWGFSQRKRRSKPRVALPFRPRAEWLEPRDLPATFSVLNLNDAGPGSFRAAIIGANTLPGPDTIDFQVAGTISLTSALPQIVDTVTIDGSTAPGFAGFPLVTVDFQNRPGLTLGTAAPGSEVRSLSLVKASGAGLTLAGSGTIIAGNYIGVLPDGATGAGNSGPGVQALNSSSGNRIGGETTKTYYETTEVTAAGGGTLQVLGWEGLRAAATPGNYLFTGTTKNPSVSNQSAGLYYEGPISAQGGQGYAVIVPNQGANTTTGSSVYGPDLLDGNQIRLVGTFNSNGNPNPAGFVFQGTVNDFTNPASFQAMPFPTANATWNYAHSTDGGLVVGNYDSSTQGGLPTGAGLAYIYNPATQSYPVADLKFPGSRSNTAYGIWHNGGTHYTIVGGYSLREVNNLTDQTTPIGTAMMVDYDSATGQFSNWKSFDYVPEEGSPAGLTHFEGVSSVQPGVYTLAATSVVDGVIRAGFVTVARKADGSFGEMDWTELEPPLPGGPCGNSVYGNQVVGIVLGGGLYQATITKNGNLIGANQSHGIQIAGKDSVIASNRIGVTVSGESPLPNGGDGIRLTPGSQNNLIGDSDPVRGIDYFNANQVPLDPDTWTGIRGIDDNRYLITGSAGSNGLLYVGPIQGFSQGTSYTVTFPGAQETSVYGPDWLGNGEVLLVGTYVLPNDTTRYGFSFQGNLATMANDLADPSNYKQIWNGSPFNFVHSAMGGFAVGNYIAEAANPAGEAGRAFLYDLSSEEFVADIVFPGTISNTAYGIWDNGDGTYTIAGGFSEIPVNNIDDRLRPIGKASLVDYDSRTKHFSNWRSYSYDGPDVDTHFMGISRVEKGVYQLSGSAIHPTRGLVSGWSTVRRETNGSFGDMTWVDLSVPAWVSGLSGGVTSANSVYGDKVVGIVSGGGGAVPYQSEINLGFQLSNLISANTGNGIGLLGSQNNRITMNQIGTNFGGDAPLPNGSHGVLFTQGSSGNLLGGEATGGNSPVSTTPGGETVFLRPPQGNLISGNRGNGVLISDSSQSNQLSGNYIGTDASGNQPLGNGLDGVAIVGSSNNALLGTTFQQNPFVFYNVISGNGANGLRITNSMNTTVQANFLGTGANNATVVANQGVGMLITGTSATIQAGGVIPLGNVISGNLRNGIEVRDRVTGLVSFNNFVGMFAFGGAAPNQLNGVSITSIAGNNLIRTSLIGGNIGHGVLIGGRANGVEIEDTAIGTDSAILAALPNGGSGIVITDTAQANAIGGFQPSIETKNHISGNLGYGIEIKSRAKNNLIYGSSIGAGFVAASQLPNGKGGILLESGTSGTVIGGADPAVGNRILYNQGHGITVQQSRDNRIFGNEIRANTGNGILLDRAPGNQVGGVGQGNRILGNGLNGIQASGALTGTVIAANHLAGNLTNGLMLNGASDLLVGGTEEGVANIVLASGINGLYAIGDCSRSRVILNEIAGGVDISQARGLVYVPGPVPSGANWVPFTTFPTGIGSNGESFNGAAVARAIANVPKDVGLVYDGQGRFDTTQIWSFQTLVYTGIVNVAPTLERIRQGFSVHADEPDDGGFFNFTGSPDQLPNIPRMGNDYYMEFMVWPGEFMNFVNGTFDIQATPFGSVEWPGPMRLIIGLGGEVYFTGDHYGESGPQKDAYYVHPLPVF